MITPSLYPSSSAPFFHSTLQEFEKINKDWQTRYSLVRKRVNRILLWIDTETTGLRDDEDTAVIELYVVPTTTEGEPVKDAEGKEIEGLHLFVSPPYRKCITASMKSALAVNRVLDRITNGEVTHESADNKITEVLHSYPFISVDYARTELLRYLEKIPKEDKILNIIEPSADTPEGEDDSKSDSKSKGNSKGIIEVSSTQLQWAGWNVDFDIEILGKDIFPYNKAFKKAISHLNIAYYKYELASVFFYLLIQVQKQHLPFSLDSLQVTENYQSAEKSHTAQGDVQKCIALHKTLALATNKTDTRWSLSEYLTRKITIAERRQK